MQAPPTPRIARSGACAFRAAAKLAPCRSPEASPVMIRMRGNLINDGIRQLQRGRALPSRDQRGSARADRIEKGFQFELQRFAPIATDLLRQNLVTSRCPHGPSAYDGGLPGQIEHHKPLRLPDAYLADLGFGHTIHAERRDTAVLKDDPRLRH